jgi:hypothetical protein
VDWSVPQNVGRFGSPKRWSVSLLNLGRFSSRPWSILFSTLVHSLLNLGPFSSQPWSILFSTLVDSLLNLGPFSSQPWSILFSTLVHSLLNLLFLSFIVSVRDGLLSSGNAGSMLGGVYEQENQMCRSRALTFSRQNFCRNNKRVDQVRSSGGVT